MHARRSFFDAGLDAVHAGRPFFDTRSDAVNSSVRILQTGSDAVISVELILLLQRLDRREDILVDQILLLLQIL